MPNILETVASSGQFSILTALVSLAEAPAGEPTIAELLQETVGITNLLAPTDAAFASTAAALGFSGDDADAAAFLIEALSLIAQANGLTLGELVDAVLRYHVLNESLAGAGVITLTPVSGQTLTLDVATGTLTDLSPESPDAMLGAEIVTDNGSIFEITNVLLPSAVLAPGAELVIGTDAADSITTGAGDDLISAGEAADTVR